MGETDRNGVTLDHVCLPARAKMPPSYQKPGGMDKLNRRETIPGQTILPGQSQGHTRIRTKRMPPAIVPRSH